MAFHFFLARLRNFPGEAGHRTNASAARFRGELIRGVQDRWTLSRAGLSPLEILICPEGNLEESLLRGVISFEFAKEGTEKRKANENDATF